MVDEDQAKRGSESALALLEELAYKTNDDRFAIRILEEVNRALRIAKIHEDTKNHRNTTLSATDRQMSYLKELGVKVSAPISRRAASSLIDEALFSPNE